MSLIVAVLMVVIISWGVSWLMLEKLQYGDRSGNMCLGLAISIVGLAMIVITVGIVVINPYNKIIGLLEFFPWLGITMLLTGLLVFRSIYKNGR